MKFLLLFLFLLLASIGYSQPVQQYFNEIRGNTVALTAFFAQMPKGGDLHHHYGGSVYAEPMLAHAIKADFFVNPETMGVSKVKPAAGKWERFSEIAGRGELEDYQQKIIQKWSVKDFNHVDYPANRQFFESFDKFRAAIDDSFEKGLAELKNRAIKENLSYIETQLNTITTTVTTDKFIGWNEQLRNLQAGRDEKAVFGMLDSLYNYLIQKDITKDAQQFNTDFIEQLHRSVKMDDSLFTMRYQNFVLRFMEPVDLFRQLVLAFISADKSQLIDGVNIVSPEHGDVSMKDYWLHMVMYKYCHARFPNVRYSLHAGELTVGLVLPEELTWHIRSAVYTAGANRIGHGVDIASEDSAYALLRYMAKHKIAVEINLTSNEFILQVKDRDHPVSLYKAFGVPIVISTDDAGILRTNLTRQYVLLAERYREFTYEDIKQLVYNSIQYSFIEDQALKNKLLKNLGERFKVFEARFPLK